MKENGTKNGDTMIKCILFDLWNTLIYNNPKYNGKKIIPQMLNLDEKDFKEFLKTKWGMKPDWKARDFFVALLEAMGKSVKENELLLEKLEEIWQKHYDSILVFEEVPAVLEKLVKRGYKLGIISNSEPPTIQLLKKLELAPFFNFTTFSFECRCLKPDRSLFQVAIQRAGAKPEEILVVGDKINEDLWPARQLGMKTVLIDRTSKEKSIYPADFKINTLEDLSEVLKKLD